MWSHQNQYLGLFRIALAMQSLCFCPPDTFVPPCSICVIYLSGNCSIKSSGAGQTAGFRTSSSVASFFPQRRLSRMVPEKGHYCSAAQQLPGCGGVKIILLYIPPADHDLSAGYIIETEMRFTSEDFAEPVPPIIPDCFS